MPCVVIGKFILEVAVIVPLLAVGIVGVASHCSLTSSKLAISGIIVIVVEVSFLFNFKIC